MNDNAQVYVLRAADGTVLYVGASGDLTQRLRQHRYTKSWWPQVASVTASPVYEKAAALSAERTLIDALSPLHNVASRAYYLRRRPAGAPGFVGGALA